MATYGTFVDATTLKASELNDLFKSSGELSAASIVAKQSVALTIGASNVRYFSVNKTVFWTCSVNFNSAGTAANAITVDFPVTASSSSFRAIGFGYFYDASDNMKLISVVKASTTTVQFMTDAGTSLTNRLGVNPAITVASGDVLSFFCMYEAA